MKKKPTPTSERNLSLDDVIIIPVFGSRNADNTLETVISNANNQLQDEQCGRYFVLQYIDQSDSEKLKDFPDVLRHLDDNRKLNHIIIDGELIPFPISMSSIKEAFERLAMEARLGPKSPVHTTA